MAARQEEIGSLQLRYGGEKFIHLLSQITQALFGGPLEGAYSRKDFA